MRPFDDDTAISAILRLIAEREAANHERHDRAEIHDRCDRVLEAKFALFPGNGKHVPSSAIRVDGARAYFTTTCQSADPLGEILFFRTTTNRHLRGQLPRRLDDSSRQRKKLLRTKTPFTDVDP
ncbi:hypothetical protein C2138_04990 [Salinibacterium hongtaonis]|nr:hypothetical protein C2138_04990 [Salinibacterium hongtaonis]